MIAHCQVIEPQAGGSVHAPLLEKEYASIIRWRPVLSWHGKIELVHHVVAEAHGTGNRLEPVTPHKDLSEDRVPRHSGRIETEEQPASPHQIDLVARNAPSSIPRKHAGLSPETMSSSEAKRGQSARHDLRIPSMQARDLRVVFGRATRWRLPASAVLWENGAERIGFFPSASEPPNALQRFVHEFAFAASHSQRPFIEDG
jgi:hypothetical protein